MKLINLVLVLILIILIAISGCDYIQQFRESPLGEEEPFISIIPEEEITEEEIKEEILEIIEEEIEEVEEIETKLTKLEVNEGELVKLKVDTYNPDGNPLTYVFSEPLDENGEWQTKKGDVGEYKVKVIVDDGRVSAEQEILIVVKTLNEAPILKLDKEITVDETETITLTPEVSDPDGDRVLVTYSGWMTSDSYTTNYDDSGIYTVTVTASDGITEVSQDVKVIVNDVLRDIIIKSITLE